METKPTIQYQDFEKLDLRVAEIKQAEGIESEVQGLDKDGNPKTFKRIADKLYKLTISLGDETRTICAGIKEQYTKEQLQGKKIIIIANLAPRTLRGIESQGMLLAASTDDHKTISLITPDQDIEPGTKIS